MLVPTPGSPARCRYCWSSEERSPVMSVDTVREVVDWLREFRDDQVTITGLHARRATGEGSPD